MRFHSAKVIFSMALGTLSLLGGNLIAQDSPDGGRKIVNRVMPQYPDLARRMQISGTVKVEALVSPNGRVKSTKVIGGSPVLTKAALDAIGAWKWAATSGESKEFIELSFRPN